MRLILGALIVAFGLLGPATPKSAAEIEGLQLRVDGLSCPFCALGLDKRLKQRAGLEGIQVHLKQGVTEASLPHGQGLDVGKVQRAVREAGLTLRGITLTVIGKISRDGENFTVVSRHDGTTFLLFDAEHQESEAGSALKPALRQRLEQAQQTDQLVKLSGLVHEHTGLPAGLMVESFEEPAE